MVSNSSPIDNLPDALEALAEVSSSLDMLPPREKPRTDGLRRTLDEIRSYLESLDQAGENALADTVLIETDELGPTELLEMEQLEGLQKPLKDVSFAREDEQGLTSHVDNLNVLLDVSANALGASTVDELLQRVVSGARRVTTARLAVAGYRYHEGRFAFQALSRGDESTTESNGNPFGDDYRDVIEELIERRHSVRLGQLPLPGGEEGTGELVGARLVGREGTGAGCIVVFDKTVGSFSAEDEALLGQLSVFTSLGLQHINARRELLAARERLIRNEKLAFLGALAGGVGHELRTPLGSIKNAAYFLKMMLSSPSGEIKEAVDILEREVETTEDIITALLDFARPRAPELKLVVLEKFVETTLSRLDIPDDVNVVWVLEPTGHVRLDAGQMEQVVRNILTNAVQAMPDGGTLTIGARPTDTDGVCISFTDTGPGIPMEHVSELFEPLFTTKARGIGLGLSVAQTLVARHGGAIEVDSEVGRGATFRINLPHVKEDAS